MRIITDDISKYDVAWWENLYKKHPHTNTPVELETFRIASELSGGKILDVGCGEGEASQYFKEYKGIDWSKTVIERAKKRFGNKFMVGDIEDVTETYDYALLSQVFEHLEDPKDYIRRIKQKAKKVIVILPNGEKGSEVVQNDKETLKDVTEDTDYHYAVYEWEDIQKMFPEAKLIKKDDNLLFVC